MSNADIIMEGSDIVLDCRKLAQRFGKKAVLHDVSFSIVRGEIVAMVGKSGVGKSTILNTILGTHPSDSGDVFVKAAGQKTAARVTAPGRDRGIVYQHYTLFSFLTARENVAMGLMLDETSIPFRMFCKVRWRKIRKEYLERAEEMLVKLQLEDALNAYPPQLSGGMKQRVALGQALIMEPEVLLLDEPFGALDEATREDLQYFLLGLYEENCDAKKNGKAPKYTIVIVTHELNEALYVGDRVIALSRFWDWGSEGHETHPGATVVYDKLAPVTIKDEERDFQVFAEQRREIRAAAFDEDSNHPREKFQSFWEKVRAGDGDGVLQHDGVRRLDFLRKPKTVSYDGKKSTQRYL